MRAETRRGGKKEKNREAKDKARGRQRARRSKKDQAGRERPKTHRGNEKKLGEWKDKCEEKSDVQPLNGKLNWEKIST